MDLSLKLSEYRNTPIAGLDVSPAQLKFNRRLRTQLPVVAHLRNPEMFPDIKQQLQAYQKVIKEYYDQSAKLLLELETGNQVHVYNRPRKPGGVL